MRRDNFDPGGLGGSQLKYDPNPGGGISKRSRWRNGYV